METRTYNVYKFEELSKEAQEKAHEEYLQCVGYHWNDEALGTLQAFAKKFDITIKDYSIDTYNVYVSWSFDFSDEEKEERKAIKLYKYLQNNIIDTIEKGKFYSVGKYGKDGKYSYKSRNSKILKEWDLTGYCIDYDILEPLKKFMSHIENINLETLIDRCIKSWGEAVKSDMQEQESFEHYKEICQINDYYFTIDGKID